MAPFYRLAPLSSRARRRIGCANDLEHAARRSWVIEAAAATMSPRALFEPTDLERVSGVIHDWHSVSDEIAKVMGGPGFHAPTVAYELHDAILSGGHLFTPRLAYRLGPKPMPWIARRTCRRVSHAVLSSTAFGLKWFGHWLFDDVPLTLAASELGQAFSALTSPSPHQVEYLQMLGLAPESGDDVYFDKLIVLQDHAQNPHKRRRHDEVHRRIVRGAAPAPPVAGVMLLRGNSGQPRGMSNESAVAAALADRGFTILDPMRLSANQLVQQCAGASILVGIEGSQLAHGIVAMRRGGTVVTLQPPARFSSIWKGICEGRDLHYAFLVGHPQGEHFSIDVDGLNRLLDRAAVPSN